MSPAGWAVVQVVLGFAVGWFACLASLRPHDVVDWVAGVLQRAWDALAGVYVPPGQRWLPSGSASATAGSPHPENDEDDPWLRGGLVTHAEALQALPRQVQLGLLAARVGR